jgi:hypothetical protein
MSTTKQIHANQLNSKKSTGPKSKVGKSIVSKNSVKHGLLSNEALLPWESQSEYDSLVTRYIDNLEPEGEAEAFLVDRIISLVWKLKRAGRTEAGLISGERYNLNSEIEVSRLKKFTGSNDETAHLNTVHAIDAFPDPIELGMIFTKNSNALANIQRYEMNLEKSLYKAWHELQRIQANRKGESTNLPVAIDVNTDFANGT